MHLQRQEAIKPLLQAKEIAKEVGLVDGEEEYLILEARKFVSSEF